MTYFRNDNTPTETYAAAAASRPIGLLRRTLMHHKARDRKAKVGQLKHTRYKQVAGGFTL
jgi:hypothetical protein